MGKCGYFRGKIEFFQTGARFEAFVRALDEIERHILVAGMLLALSRAPAGKIWVEKVKQQLTASLTTTVKLPKGKDLISPNCFGRAARWLRQRMISVNM